MWAEGSSVKYTSQQSWTSGPKAKGGGPLFSEGVHGGGGVCKRNYTGLAYRQPPQPTYGRTTIMVRVLYKHTRNIHSADVNLWCQLM